ncbi:hypothetical protein, partial [Melissococcus plutonius]|uniref:hypothetical protein n=1 Tax=Melissococcus plutonius TaxID=33970 RepID=UPI003C2D71FA
MVRLLCSVFKGLPLPRSNSYILSRFRSVVNSFLKVFSPSLAVLFDSNFIILPAFLLFVNNFFRCFFNF